MRFLLLVSAQISIYCALECLDFLDSPLIPLNLNVNKTCTSDYCYRIEYNITHLDIGTNEQSVLMVQLSPKEFAILYRHLFISHALSSTRPGCLYWPLEQIKLGCRRNFQGWILCVCDADHCNDAPSRDVFDLPIVRNCRDQLSGDGGTDDGKTCTSNYCITYRMPHDPSAGDLTAAQYFGCQDKSTSSTSSTCGVHCCALLQFDLFVYASGATVPAGICVKHQTRETDVFEMCSCQYRDNCTTSTKYPQTSGWPLDTRGKEFIDCATPSILGGMRKCRGHVCFIMKEKNRDDEYGCVVYDERFMDKKYKLGTHRILDAAYFFCDKNMCNANENPDKVFAGIHSIYDDPPANASCNCYAPPPTEPISVKVLNLTLLLSIAIPCAFLLFVLSVVLAFRVYTKRWPFPFPCKKRPRVAQKSTVTTVAWAQATETKKKLY